MNDFKKRIENAILRHSEKSLKRTSQQEKRRNKKPEADLRQSMLIELRKRGFLILYVESQAVFSVSAGRYLNSQAQPGTSDLVGLNSKGHFVAIELKAPGRLKTLRDNQRIFLENVIHHGGFAACVDSLDLFDWIYNSWVKIDSESEAKKFLIEQIPVKPRSTHDAELFKME